MKPSHWAPACLGAALIAVGPQAVRRIDLLLSEGTDPNLLYVLQTRLADYHIYMASEIDAFAAVWFDPKATQEKLHSLRVRTDVRTRWYLSPEGQTYRTYALQSDELDCDLAIERAVVEKAEPYPATAKPAFVGHYWLSANRPEVLAENVACLDYSVAKGGFLCAYRWQGEQKLNNDHFVWAFS